MQVYGGAKEDPLAELVACNSRVTTAPSHGTAVMTALGACEEMYKHLVQRKWLLAVANEGCPDFVTCDSPVVTMQKTGKTAKLPRAGFHFPNTIVAFPLNRRVVLLGFNDGSERSSRHNCDTAAIAGINAAVIWATHRFVWSRRRRIYYMLNGIVNDPALAFAVRRRSSQPPAK
jgi:hypothetical protein